MNRYTRHVLDATKQDLGSVSDIQRLATKALVLYPLTHADWPPRVQPNDWWDAASQKVLRLIEDAWTDLESREHIRQLAALGQLIRMSHEAHREWSEIEQIIVAVGDELNIWENWPEIHDVRNFFPPLPVVETGSIQRQQPKTLWDRLFGPSDRIPSTAQVNQYQQWSQNVMRGKL